MNFNISKAKPLIYSALALAFLYFLFSLKQPARAQNDNNSRNTEQQQRNSRTNNRNNNRENSQSNTSNSNSQRENQNSNQRQNSSTQNNSQNRSNFRQRYEQAGNNERDRLNQSSSSFGFFELTFILLILSAIGYIIYKYVSRKKGSNFATTDYINVLSTTALAANKHLQVVQIFNKVYILGVGENSVNLITEVNDPNLVSQIRKDAATRLPSLTFKEQIMKFINKMKVGNSMKSDPEDEALSFFEKQRNKLNGFKDKDGEP